MSQPPIWVYDNWGAYVDDEESRLTEEFSLRQLAHVARLQESGVHFDAYMMNAFWFDPAGSYRDWRTPDWPDGPGRWIEGCRKQGLLPGLWFGSNSLWKIDAVIPEWLDSVDPSESAPPWNMRAMSMSEGGFLAHFMETLDRYYDLGVRLFEFDVCNFDAATANQRSTLTPEEIRRRNIDAFMDALVGFRARHPDVRLAAFNGFGGDWRTTTRPLPFEDTIDPRFIEVFDSLYVGDIQVSDVPHTSHWRSLDLFGDHMVRMYEDSSVPLHMTDPFLVFATTSFGHYRGANAWRSILLLTAARGSWKKTIYGDVSVLDDDDARWFARVQEIYRPLLASGTTETFGGIPGRVEPYGFVSSDESGALSLVVNPAQDEREISPPRGSEGRVLFTDLGFVPVVSGDAVRLGPGQLALIGTGRYASPDYDLGFERDIVIPTGIENLAAEFSTTSPTTAEAWLTAPGDGIRVVVRQFTPHGDSQHTVELDAASAADRENGEGLVGHALTIEIERDGTALPLDRDPTLGWHSGTSWAVAELAAGTVPAGTPLVIRCSTRETEPVVLDVVAYAVRY